MKKVLLTNLYIEKYSGSELDTVTVANYFVENGYDEYYGARPLKRLVSRELETVLAKQLIENAVKPNAKLEVDYQDDKIIINQK